MHMAREICGLVSCLRNNMYFAGGQLAVFQGANEVPLSSEELMVEIPKRQRVGDTGENCRGVAFRDDRSGKANR